MTYAKYIEDYMIDCPDQDFVCKLIKFIKEHQIEYGFISVGDIINYLREQGMSDVLTDEPDSLDWKVGWNYNFDPIKGSWLHIGSDICSVVFDHHISFVGG